MSLLALLLFALVPLGAWRYARIHAPKHVWCVTGASLGAVVSPLSMGLYSTYFFGPFGLPTGMLGLMSTLFHGPPGFHLAHWLRLVPYDVVSGAGHVYIELLNGVTWGVLYGLLGAIVDWLRFRIRHEPAP